LITSPAL